MSWFLLILSIIGVAIILYLILTLMDRNKIYHEWNKIIVDICSYQNETDRAFREISSLQSAWVCQNKIVHEIHRSIFLRHDDLLHRVEEYFRTMIECAEEKTYLTSTLSQDQNKGRPGGIRYFPFQTNRILTVLAETFGLNQTWLPSLNLGLLIIEPQTKTSWQTSLSSGLYRYHYALKLPHEGNFGLYLRQGNQDNLNPRRGSIHWIKWKERKGFVWDATFEHHLENHTLEPCFILVADIPRYLPWKYHNINLLLHTYFPPLPDTIIETSPPTYDNAKNSK